MPLGYHPLSVTAALLLTGVTTSCAQANRLVPLRVEALLSDSLPRTASTGSLIVIPRPVDWPERALPAAYVQLEKDGVPVSRPITSAPRTNALGLLRLDNLAPGNYVVRIASLGFRPDLVQAEVVAGCVARLEVYLATAPFCEFACQVTPARAVLTTCTKRRR